MSGLRGRRINASQPESRPISLYRKRLVPENFDAVAFEDGRDGLGVGTVIVIAEHSNDGIRCPQLRQQVAARHHVLVNFLLDRSIRLNKWHADEIAGQHNEVRFQAVHYVDTNSIWLDREVWVVMEVAKLRDGETVESRRQAAERNFETDQVWAVCLA